MKYILLLVTVAIIYIVLAHSGSIAPASKAVTESMEAANPPAPGASASPHTDALKAPLDRTHEVLDQVRKQKSGEQF
ncbi:MAG: hypothetical protein WCD79_02290 [Chthoniobacteraceae bacterium]